MFVRSFICVVKAETEVTECFNPMAVMPQFIFYGALGPIFMLVVSYLWEGVEVWN